MLTLSTNNRSWIQPQSIEDHSPFQDQVELRERGRGVCEVQVEMLHLDTCGALETHSDKRPDIKASY